MNRVVPSGSASIQLKSKLRTLCRNRKGYVFVTLAKDQVAAKGFYVHRLVASAFVENPMGYFQVTHLDGDLGNNCAPNLQWGTSLMNGGQRGQRISTEEVVSAATGSPEPTQETWRAVLGYEGLYEVSDLGRVRSLDHYVRHRHGGNRLVKGQNRAAVALKPYGYKVVHLSKNGATELRLIHRLVAEAFLGPCPLGLEVAHWDGDPANPRLENLRYATRSDNSRDKYRHGTQPEGVGVHNHKLVDADVREIRMALVGGASKMSQARKFGVSHKTIRNLAAGLIWNHVR